MEDVNKIASDRCLVHAGYECRSDGKIGLVLCACVCACACVRHGVCMASCTCTIVYTAMYSHFVSAIEAALPPGPT